VIPVEYRTGAELDLDEVIELYVASTLAERRPADDRERMREMLVHANLVVSAHAGGLLVGIARSITDWAYVTYLSDLAVRGTHQRRGIGAELIARTHAAAPRSRLILLSAPGAVGYYPRIGMERHPAAFTLPPRQ
jgi:GNAT superfamily N-acetyltransferase